MEAKIWIKYIKNHTPCRGFDIIKIASNFGHTKGQSGKQWEFLSNKTVSIQKKFSIILNGWDKSGIERDKQLEGI